MNAAERHESLTGLELEMGGARIQVDDKKIINCRADLNQLVPFKYKWRCLSRCTTNSVTYCQIFRL